MSVRVVIGGWGQRRWELVIAGLATCAFPIVVPRLRLFDVGEVRRGPRDEIEQGKMSETHDTFLTRLV